MCGFEKFKEELPNKEKFYGFIAEFLTFLKDIVKPSMSIQNFMTQNKNQNILHA